MYLGDSLPDLVDLRHCYGAWRTLSDDHCGPRPARPVTHSSEKNDNRRLAPATDALVEVCKRLAPLSSRILSCLERETLPSYLLGALVCSWTDKSPWLPQCFGGVEG